MPDPHNLQRFLDAQTSAYPSVLDELRSGHKTGHWMWFIFPQIRGLGSSPTAVHFAISGRAEAEAYLAHFILGPRLVECTTLVLAIQNRTARQIFGDIDTLKLRSSMTLFANTAGASPVFQQLLDKLFAAQPDPATLRLLGTP